jgi:hypothetical protein
MGKMQLHIEAEVEKISECVTKTLLMLEASISIID